MHSVLERESRCKAFVERDFEFIPDQLVVLDGGFGQQRLSYSRKGFSESVTRLTVESFIRVLENAFWRLGGVPNVVVFDAASCAVKHAERS